MYNTTDSYSKFAPIASEVMRTKPDVVKRWSESNDIIERALARAIQECTEAQA